LINLTCRCTAVNLKIKINIKTTPAKAGVFCFLGVYSFRGKRIMIENNLISLQLEKEVTSLFKYYLEELEQLKLDPEKHEIIRKKILDHGNDTIRNMLLFLGYFDFQINAKKVEDATKQRIVYKKTIICPPIILK
jgi:hypothetical protein